MTEISHVVLVTESKESVSSGTGAVLKLRRFVSVFSPFQSLWLRLAILCAIAVGEVLLLGFLVDTGSVSRREIWWASWVDRAPQVLQVVITTCVAWLLLGWSGVTSLLRPSDGVCEESRLFRCLLVHLTCYAAFAFVSCKVFSYPGSLPQESWIQESWMIVWLIVGVANAVTFPMVVWPLRALTSLFIKTRLAILGAAVIGIMAWIVGEMANQSWRPLAGGTFTLVQVLLNCIYDDVLIDRPRLVLGTMRYSVHIAPACSGYEGLGLIGVFLLAFSWAFRDRLRFPHTLLMLPIALAVVWLLNAVRIAALVAIGTSWSADVAGGGFHSQAGWLVFNFVALAIVAISTRVKFFAKVSHDDVQVDSVEVNETASYLAPFLAVIVIGMVTEAFNANSDTFVVALRVIAALGVMWFLRRGLHGLNWSFSCSALVLGAAVYVAWIFLPSGTYDERPGFNADQPPALFLLCIAMRLVSYVFVTPIIEELAFRGFVMRRVVSPDFSHASLAPFPWTGIFFSSILFGMFHNANWISGTIAGLIYGIAFARSKRLGDSVAAHATTNCLLAIHAILTGNWSVWT